MRIVYFGTPEFAVPSLKILLDKGHDIVSVVTAPDRERGRGRKVSFTPVKEFAKDNNLKILQPDDFKDDSFIAELKKLDADIFVVVAFRILPRIVYSIPKFGAFNLHGSILPKYRGAAPIQWALINGDKETGLTTFFLEEKVDTGTIILQSKIEILEEDNLGTLHDKMMINGAELVLKTVGLIENNSVEPIPQSDSLASPAPKITKETCKINWENSSEKINNLIRGLSPYPCAFFVNGEKSYKVYLSKISEKYLSPGEILQTKKELFIGTGDKAIQIMSIQPQGRKRMTVEEFCRGYSLNNK